MKKIFKKFVLLWVSIGVFAGIYKKKETQPMNDAIQLPGRNNQMIVEDYEMAAYHNQA
jgi:hypothetical protein